MIPAASVVLGEILPSFVRAGRGIAVAGLLALALVACGGDGGDERPPTAGVERGTIERLVVATGTIEPEKQVDVRPRLSGIVMALHVEPGDTVTAGQVLLEIDREMTEVQLREAAALLQEAEVEQRFARASFERAKAQRARGTMPEERFDEAESRNDRAATLVARMRAQQQRLEVELRHATVVAPLAGTVLVVDIEEGAAVASVHSVTGGTRVLSIAADAALHLDGLVDENEIRRVALGQTARIRTEAYGDRIFEGQVQKIAPIGQRQQNVTYFEVEIAVIDPDAALLKPKMSGDADIVVEVIEGVLLVPETGLRYDGDAVYVEAVTSSGEEAFATERRDVETGVLEGDRVQILSGVAEGEEIRLR